MKQTDEGFLLFVKISPKASVDQVVGWEGERLKIKVRAPPEKGKANEAVIKLLAKYLDVPKSSISIVSGETAKLKTLLIKGRYDFARYFEGGNYRAKS